ncbi:MAG TPA: vanadium-dependent haloperoxidase [Chitinophagaceae bacterium]|nr:vanadium-dependent haloperoxidase [Chitinophagaceae bacterium]
MRNFAILFFLVLAMACKQKDMKQQLNNPTDASYLNQSVIRLNDVVIYDIFSPPVASRVYAYSTLAAFEASRWMDTSYTSLTAQLNGFPEMPAPDPGKTYDFRIAGIRAFFSITQKLTFTKDSSRITEEQILKELKEGVDGDVYKTSISFGEAVADAVWQRATKDQYKECQGMPRYTPVDKPGKWKVTPPDYLDAIQPFWTMMKPLVMDSSSQFKPIPPPTFSMDTVSQFYKEMKEVYDISKTLTDEQKNMARFWDDNAAAITYKGHMMFANKKPSPGGHWMNITALSIRKKNLDWLQAAQTYALVAVSMYDAFISCWDEKFRSEFIRPVTAINESIDKNWQPFLQTPPFPEYTSGHSVASSAMAAMLTSIFGDNFAFTDDYEMPYIGIQRNFPSFVKASEEACMSRLYGGIHFMSAIMNGRSQGRALGAHIVGKLHYKKL